MSDRASSSSERQDSRQEDAHFKRSMQTRHLVMLSLGGVIGTGLFLSSGYTVQQAGPVGAVLAYLVGGIVAWLVMMCLGELAVHMPDSGAFSAHASRYIGPGTGYMVAWMYWLTWTVALGSEFTAVAVFMGRWFPDIPGWYWSGLFAAVVFGVNAFTSRFFAESEFWLSLIKVIAVVVFVVVGAGAIIGWVPLQDASGASVASPGLSAFWGEGAMSPSLLAIGTTLLAVMFAFSGTELIGIAAGETVDPARNVPKAIRATLWRLILFFVGTIIVIAALLPQSQAGLSQSPFVAVFQRLGVPGAADIMNFVIITALLSAANSGLYASSRMLWTLSDQGTLPKSLGQQARHTDECAAAQHDWRLRRAVLEHLCPGNRLLGAGVDFWPGGCRGVDGDCAQPAQLPSPVSARRRTARGPGLSHAVLPLGAADRLRGLPCGVHRHRVRSSAWRSILVCLSLACAT